VNRNRIEDRPTFAVGIRVPKAASATGLEHPIPDALLAGGG
jgi:hypothetical protein